MILLIDNYDSFVFNLARYLTRLGASVRVVRHDDSQLFSLAEQSKAIVLSPGPRGPEHAGQCVAIVQQMSGKIPILGICLGHQVICYALGGRIQRAAKPIHGRALPIALGDSPLFAGIGRIARFARYHSLVAAPESMPDCLRVVAHSLDESDGDTSPAHEMGINYPHTRAGTRLSSPNPFQQEIMAVQHREHLTFGVQFHPESILSNDGYRLLANFLRVSGLGQIEELPESDLQTTQEK